MRSPLTALVLVLLLATAPAATSAADSTSGATSEAVRFAAHGATLAGILCLPPGFGREQR